MKLQILLDAAIVLLMVAILTTLSLPVCIAVLEQTTKVHSRPEHLPAPTAPETVLS